MPKTGYTVLIGAEEFQKDCLLAIEDFKDLSPATRPAANIVLNAARVKVPKLTGALAASMYKRSDPMVAEVATNLVYAPVIHFGWRNRNIEAQPWLAEASRQSEPVWIQEYETLMDKAINRMDKNYVL